MLSFRRAILFFVASSAVVAFSASARAQFKPEDEKPGGVKFDKELVQRIRIGMKVKAVGGNCMGVYGTVPFPMDWPEQKVTVVGEEFSAAVKRRPNRQVDGTVQQMLVTIPQLKSGEEAVALVTLEVHRRSILPPDDTTVFSIPTKDQLDADVKRYLSPSPKIESAHKSIKDLSKEILGGAKDKNAWEQVEAIYDWVRENVEYTNGPLKGALAALKDKNGDCEELTSLFIALCRAGNIPARTVWVPGHCYPEFYLVDRSGQGHWFPCQAAGSRAFGGIPEHRPILQKGDSFKDVDRPRERMRYLSEYLTGKVVKGGGEPHVRFIREDVATDKPLDDTTPDISPIQPAQESKNPAEEGRPRAPIDGDDQPGDAPIRPRIDPRAPKLPPGVAPKPRQPVAPR
ncbi:MAG: transglutaminase [Planctomycetota bacterium]|nr:MAG: transglutaminase [Planctomycetota bacterium]